MMSSPPPAYAPVSSESIHLDSFRPEDAGEMDDEYDEDGSYIANETPERLAQKYNNFRTPPVDTQKDRYPFCLVWGPLPVISWFIPWIGHLGIADSEGRVHDFAGPYSIGLDNFMVPVTKYAPIDVHKLFPATSSPTLINPSTNELLQSNQTISGEQAKQWDECVKRADAIYRKRMHNLFCDNCHHHSALSLFYMSPNFTEANSMLSAFFYITRRAKFKSTGAWFGTYTPFLLLCLLVYILMK